jgi:hypothetical protein
MPWPIEQVGPAFLLRIVRVLDLQPPDAGVIGIRETLRNDTFEVVRAHQLKEFAAPAGDGKRLGKDRRTLRQNVLQPPPALAERQRLQIGPVEPEDVEGDVTGAPRHPEQLVELWSAGLIGRDHLAVDYGFVDIEQPANLVGERVETTKHVSVARDDTTAALLDVTEAPKPIVFELKEPFGVIERLLSPGRDDRLYAGKCHPVNMGATG